MSPGGQFSGIVYLLQFHVRLVSLGRTNVEHVFKHYERKDTNYDKVRCPSLPCKGLCCEYM